MASILLADDDTALREFVQRALVADGHKVVAVDDGSEALQHLEAASFDMLVSDVDMPGLDGLTLAARVAKRASGPKVLLISGLGHELKRAEGLPANRVATLQKPFTLEQLRKAVRALLAA